MKKLFLFGLVLLCFSSAPAQSRKSPTLRELFMQLPEKYFSIDCCEGKTYREAKTKYLKLYLLVEDQKNGFLSGDGSAAQGAFEMAIFKRPNSSAYLVAFFTEGEGDLEDFPWCVFLDYQSGKWREVSKVVVPNYDPKKLYYQLPRKGTTIEVFEKDETAEYFKGKKLYDLVWSGGKFSVRK